MTQGAGYGMLGFSPGRGGTEEQMRRLTAALCLVIMLFSAAAAEGFMPGVEPDRTEITPAFRSEHRPGHENCYWCTPMDLTDEDAVWKMLTAPMTVVDLDMMKQTVCYREPDENSEAIGMITGSSQGVHVLETLDNGWSLIETYSTSFHDSRVKNYNAFVTGYIRSEKLKTVQVNQDYGIIIDKLTQRLYFFRDGHAETSLAISTGLYNKKQPYNESRSGEYMIIYTKTGALIDGNMHCDYALRFNAADYLHEVPYIIQNGQKNYKGYENRLGTRASHGCLRVQRNKNAQGYNMRKLSELIKKRKDKNCVKLVVWEDYQGRQVKIPEDDTPLYYNPKKGTQYHAVADCASVRKKFLPLTAFTFGELEEGAYAKLAPCPYCQPTPRRAELEEINEIHRETSPGEVMSYWGKDQ